MLRNFLKVKFLEMNPAGTDIEPGWNWKPALWGGSVWSSV